MGTNCPICFDELENKIKASPDACDHVFCLTCLERWSKLGSFCPIDRKRYRKVINLSSEDVIQIKRSKRKRTKTVYDFSAKCELCSNNNSPGTLLLCDCCDLGFHCSCLNLEQVPSGLWFCPDCVSVEEKLRNRISFTKVAEADFGYEFFQNKIKSFTTKYSSKSEFPNKEVRVVIEDICNNSRTFQVHGPKISEATKDIFNKSSKISVETTEGTSSKISPETKEDVTSKSSKIPPESTKGTVSYLSSTFKNENCDTKTNLVPSCSIEFQTEENLQFSVFENIGDVQVSLEKYTNVTSLAGFLLMSETNFARCSFCKDMISFSSKKLCKICKAKYFRNISSRSKNEKFRISGKQPSSSNIYSCTKSYTQMFHFKKAFSQTPVNVLERRKKSLYHELTRLYDKNKKIPSVSTCYL